MVQGQTKQSFRRLLQGENDWLLFCSHKIGPKNAAESAALAGTIIQSELTKLFENDTSIPSITFTLSQLDHNLQVFLPSCSSDEFSGTRGRSSTGNLLFHGRHIFSSLLRDLVARFDVANAEDVVLIGSGFFNNSFWKFVRNYV